MVIISLVMPVGCGIYDCLPIKQILEEDDELEDS